MQHNSNIGTDRKTNKNSTNTNTMHSKINNNLSRLVFNNQYKYYRHFLRLSLYFSLLHLSAIEQFYLF